jgi:magnesium-transporting ATPase (P-type)
MPILPTDIIPKNILTALRGASSHVQFSSLLLGVGQSDSEEAFRGLQTGASGLSEEEAGRRLEEYGPNVVTQEQRHGRIKLLGRACANPLVILLLLLATVALVTGDARASSAPTVSLSSRAGPVGR